MIEAEMERMSRRNLLKLASAAAISAVLPGCGGGGSQSGSGQFQTFNAPGSVNHTEIGGNDLRVVSAWKPESIVAPDGSFTTVVSGQGTQVLSLIDKAGKPRAMCVSIPDPTLQAVKQFDAESTILAILFMSPGVYASESREAQLVLNALRGLSAFDPAVSLARALLSTAALPEALSDSALANSLRDCMSEWVTRRTFAGSKGIEVGGTKDGFTVEVSIATNLATVSMNDINAAWRYLRIHRRELRADGSEIRVLPISTFAHGGLLPGAVAASWGSLLTGTFGSPSHRIESDLTDYTTVATSEYWIEGPGLKTGGPTLPPGVPSDPLEALGLTVAYYLVMPFISCLAGFANGADAAIKLVKDVWDVLKSGLSFDQVLQALASGNQAALERALIDIVATLCGGSILAAVLVAMHVPAGAATVAAALVLAGFSALFLAVNVLQFATLIGRYRPVEKLVVTASVNRYEYVKAWGVRGTANGQFDWPSAIAIDRQGRIYTAEHENNRVQQFDAGGAFISKWGSSGTGNGQFVQPLGIAVDNNGNVFVVDSGHNRVQKFSTDGTFLASWATLLDPLGIAVDSLGFIYVANTDSHAIQKFDSAGTLVLRWGSYGATDGNFVRPRGLAVDAQGFVYVSDDNHRIQKFTSHGLFVKSWGSFGTGDGQFAFPRGVAVDSGGLVYVADSVNSRIQKFSANGDFSVKWGSTGSGDGQFRTPYALAVAGTGYVYVCDADNSRIQVFRPLS